MKKAKSIFLTALVFSMIFIIILGLYELKLGIWKAFITGFAIVGFILAIKKFYNWIMNDNDPVEIMEVDGEEMGEIPWSSESA